MLNAEAFDQAINSSHSKNDSGRLLSESASICAL